MALFSFRTGWGGALPPPRSFLPRPRVEYREGLPDVAVCASSGLGDVVLALPAVRELADTHNVMISRRTPEYLAEMLRLSPHVCAKTPGPGVPELNVNPYVEGDGIERIRREPRQENIARRCGVEPRSWAPELCLPAGVLERMDEVVSARREREGAPVIALALNANSSRRTMPVDAQKALIDRLAGRYAISLVHHSKTFGDLYDGRVLDYGGVFGVTELVAFLAVHDGAVCVDSGPAHIAAAVQTPLVVLMGAVGIGNHIRYEGWYGGRVREITEPQPCQPCWVMARYPRDCVGGPGTIGCLRVPPERVIGALDEIL